jgi:hypothetical protein
MGKLLFTAAIVASAAFATPASAAVVILATNVDLRSGPATVGVTQTDRFTFSFQPREQFDPSPVLVSTTGNAAVTAFFGAPSVSFTERPTVFGPSSFPGFASIPNPTRAPFSLSPSDLGLRFTIGADDFFGFARFAGPTLFSVAFETDANTPIRAGSSATVSAVPEPATWAMMLVGFGVVGYSMRKQPRAKTQPA